MATDTTGVSTETASTQAQEHDVERIVLTQGVTQVQVPDGTELVRIQVTPGETIQLPFPNDRMMARLDDGNGNLAIKVGDVTVILQGYIAATGEADVILIDNAGQAVDVAAVVAATDPNLDIATAAGPGAGDQGTGPDNNGGLFAPFDPAAGIGGLNAIGGLGATQLQYGLIEREFDIIEEDAEETDTSPVLVSLTPGDPVNEDDLERQESSLAKALDPFPNHIQDGLSDVLGGNTPSYWGHPEEQGNDPFDTNDHEYPSQNGYSDNYWGVDQDREPLTTTAIASVNFFGDVPGHLSFGTGTQPIVEQLAAMGLTSHSHELQYVVLPGLADDPNTAEDESHGETLVAYYVETYGEGEQTYSYATIVFTIAMREFEGTDPISDFNIDFTIYGVIDNVPGIADADGNILEALDIDVPFFMVDSGGSSVQVPAGTLIFKDIDDVPSFGSLTYDWVELGEEGGAWLPVGKNPTDTDIEHDETPGVQGQEEQNAANYSWHVDQALAAAGLDGVTPLGAALTELTVSFGADGRAGTHDEGGYTGNKEAGKTVFAGDGDANATAFQLYMGTSAVPLSEGQTNWTTNINGEPQIILARQIDAQTIVGYVPGVAEGEDQATDIPVFVLRIDPATGEVVLVQLAQINHGDASDSNDLVDNLLITPLGGGGTLEVLSDNFDSLANWSSIGGDFVRVVGDVGTVDPQPNPANQALLTSGGGEEGESSSAQDIADFFGLDIGALDVVNDGNPANGDENATNGSAIKREVDIQAGDTLTVRFNFLENEDDGEGSGPSYQDMAFIVIGGEVIRLANVGDLGTANSGSDGNFSWSEESGYLTFTYTFTTTGPIQIGFGVMNEGDEAVDVGLLVDHLSVTRGDHGVTARATDYDGDFVETPLTVVIRDDGPTISSKLDWMVDEDGKDGGTPLAGGLPGGPGDGNGGTWIGFSNKSLGINFGTDGPAVDAIAFDPAKIVLRDTTGAIVSPLKSHGVEVVFTWNAATSQLVGKAGDTEIMVLSVDQANGTVSFALKGPVDHPYSDDPYAPGTDLAFEDEFQIDFGFIAKDADGDTVEHTMTVRVDDDSPTLEAVSEASVNLTLDESVGADASDPQTAPNADEPAETGAIGTVTGTVTGLFQNIQFGADGPGAATAYKLILKDVGGAGTLVGTTEVPTNLQVNDPNGLYPVDNIVLVSVSDYQINAYVGSYDGESDDNVLAFLVRVDKATGELTVSQFLPLSHGTDGSDALSHDDILTLAVPRGGGIYVSATVSDFDGDKATVEAPAPLGISFEDDGPKATGWEFETNTRDKDFNPETKDDIYAIIDEDELPGGGQNFYSGDDDGGTKASGFVLADFGSDGAAAENGGFALNLDAGILAALKTAAGLDLHIDLANSDAGQLTVRDSNDALVFTLTLHPDAQNPSKGAWDFELHQALKHSQADTEDNIHISFGVTLTDGDGDTATSAIRIMVDDDMPAPEPDVGGSYVELTKNDLGTVEDFLLANDLPGADGLKSIEILYNGASDDNKGGKLEIIGGHVWYTAPNVQDDTNEVFWYRLTDNDGDTRDTSVTVTVTDRGGGDGSVSLKITGVGGYEDDENGMQGQTDVDPVNQQLSLPFNLKITVIDAGDTADSITIGGVPTGAVLKYGLVDLPAADGSGNITITRGGAFDALLDALTTAGGADVDVVLAEHDSRDFTLTLNGVVDQVAISQGSKEAIVDAVAAQPAFTIEPLDQSKVEAGELATATTFTVNTQVAFADFGDGNETQYIFIKTPTEPGWTLGDVSVNGNVLTPVVNPLAGNLGYPGINSGYTVYAVSTEADSGTGTVPVTIVVNGPNDPTDTVTKTLEVKAVAIDVEEGSLATDPLNNVGVATQTIDLTVTDRTGGTDEVSFVGGGLGGYEDNEATSQGQSNVDEPSDQQLSLTFNLKATATDPGDAVDSVEVGGIPSGATATWTGPGGLSLTFAPGLTTITPTSGGTGTDASRAAFLADLIDGNGANITLTLAEHDSRDVTLTMKSVIDGTATAGANAGVIVDAVAAQPVFTPPAPSAQSKVETGLPASFLITTSVNFADVADANEKQYVLVKLPAAGWTLNFVTPTGNFESTAVVALPGYPGYYVLEVQPTETGALPLTLSINGPSDVAGSVSEEIEIRALTVDAVEGLDLDPANNTAEAVQKVTLTVTDSTPTVNAQAAITVDEDGLAGANAGANDDAKGDDPADDSASQTGNFSITSPVDSITAIKLETTGGLTGLETLDGKAVRTVWDSGSSTLVGFADLNNDGIKDAGERTVFTLAVINPATGAYKLDLLEALKHSASNGGMGASYEDDLGFTVNITVTDDDGSTGTGTVSIVIDDDTPTANNDGAFEVAEDTPLPISVFGNDKFGADGVDTGDAANITFTQGAKGSVAYDPATGLFTYSPNAGAEGADSFTYTIKDKDGDTSTATVTVNIAKDSEPLVGTPTNVTVDEDGFAFANKDNLTPRSDETSSTNSLIGAGSVVVSFGNDVPLDLPASIVLLDTPGLDNQLQTLDSQNVTFAKVGNDLVGTVSGGAVEVIRISLTAPAAGPGAGQVTYTYQVELKQPIKHPAGVIENTDLLSGITFEVTDKDGDTKQGNFSATVYDDVPSLAASATQPDLVVDESSFGDNATANFAGVFTAAFGADGMGADKTYALGVSAPGAVSGLVDTESGLGVYLFLVGSQVVGKAGVDAAAALIGSTVVFTVSVDAGGNVILDQQRAVTHDNDGGPGLAHDDPKTLLADDLVTLTATIVDQDGDAATATANIGTNLVFKDDGPSLSAGGVIPTLTVDESNFAVDHTLSFANVFVPTYGADGAGSVGGFALGINAGVTGLVDTLSGQPVVLSMNGSVVEGKTNPGGDLVFTVSVDASGNVTLNQLRAVVHPTANPDEPKSLDAANLITLTATVTDKDGDTNTATADIAQNLVFKDDGPAAGDKNFGSFQEGAAETNLSSIAAFVAAHVAGGNDQYQSGSFTLMDGATPVTTLVGSLGGTLTLSGGNILYTPPASVDQDGATSETFTYRIADKDGDLDTGLITVSLTDGSGPVLALASGTVDEEGLTGGLAGTAYLDGSDAPGESKSTGGTLGVTLGSDPLASDNAFNFTGVNALGGLQTLDNTLVVLSGPVAGGDAANTILTYTGYKNGGNPLIPGDQVFVVTLNQDTGQWSFELKQPVKHPDANTEDNLPLSFGVSVTDIDGTVGTNIISVSIDDDSPTLSAGGIIPTLTVDESNFAFDHTLSFAGVFVPSYGADGAGTVGGFTLGINAGATGLVDTATNLAVNLFLIGGAVVGSTATLVGDVLPGNTVFTVSVDGAGNVTLNQLRAVVHPTADPDEPKSLSAANLITLTATVTDKDGDTNTATANIGDRLVFKDDGPTAISDGMLTITTLGVPVSGTNLLDNDNAGADGGKTVIGIRLGGEVGSYAAVGAGGTDIQIKADGTEGTPAIGTLHVNPDGSWTFTQTEGSELAPIAFSYQMKDADGDIDTASFYVNPDSVPTVTVTNDGPQTVGGEALVDEDWITNGNKDNPASPGDDAGTASASGTWSVSGGDPSVIVGLGITSGATPTGATALNGLPILWFTDSTTVPATLHGKTDAAGADYFTLTVNDNGTWSFTLLQPVQHGTAGTEDNVLLNPVQLIAIDLDGDSASATIKIAIDDDMPVAAASGSNLGVTLDESFLLANMGPAPLAAYFAPVKAGGDGLESVVYKLTGANGAAFVDGTNSNLVDTASGLPVLLYQDGNGIVGKAGTETVLVITISGDTITFDQQRAVVHADPSNPNDAVDMAGVVYITQIVTDKDGDQASATTANPIALAINDDGPTAISDGMLTITTLNVAVSGTNLLANDSAGADGGKTVVGIRLGGEVGIYAPVDLGGTDIQIKADGSEGTPAIGTLHVNPDGSWTFTQTEGSELAPIAFSYQMKDKDGDIDTASFYVNPDSVPTVTVTNDGPQTVGGEALVDEDWITNGNKDNPASPGDDAGTASASGTWSVSGGDPSVIVGLGITSGATPTGATALNGLPILWFTDSTTVPATLHGKTDAAGADYFTLTVNDNGTWSFTLLQPVQHGTAGTEDNVLLNPVQLIAIDLDGDSASATIKIAIDDDMPVIAAADKSTTLTVDESFLGSDASASFAANFTAAFGADGEGTLIYALAVKAEGIASGLVDTATNQAVSLHQVGATVVGKNLNGDVVFVLSVDAGGSVTLDQQRAVKHPTNGVSHDEPTSLSADDLVTLTAVITDRDGDSKQASIDIGQNLVFKDDGPSITPSVAVTLDDDALGGNADGTGDQNPNSSGTTGSLAFNFGADGAHPSAAIAFTTISTTPFLTGIERVPDGANAWLVRQDGVDIFRLQITNAATGAYQITQINPLQHPAGDNENDVTFNLGLSIMDGDGDTALATISVNIDDDTPVAGNDGKLADLDDNAAGVTIGTVAGILANDFYGADGKAATGDLVIGAGDKGGSVSIVAGNLVYTSATNVTPGATVTETFTYTIKDKDGDTKSATFSVNLTDTKATFSVAPANSSVDEEGLGGGNAGDSYVTGDLAGQAVSVTGQALNINYGTDTPGSVSFDVAQAGLAGLQTSNGTPVNFTIIGGTLLLGYTGGVAPTGTGDAQVVFHASLNGAGTGTYDFTLKQALRHPTANAEDDLALTFSVTAKDSEGEGSSATFTVTVDDDAPLANADTRTMDEQSTITGNVYGVTGAGAGDVADAIGADGPNAAGAVISGKSVNLAGATKNVDADGEVITGQYGNLTLKSDGTYSYQAGSVSGGNKQDVFEYTIKDADGDTKTTTLTINVNDQINFIPDAVDDVNNTSSTPLDYQLMLILDFSGSMDEIVSTPEGDKTRLEIARDSLISLLEQYKNSTTGSVSVKLIGFAEYTPFSAQYLAGSNSAFATVDAAIAALQAVTPTQGNGNTDYDDALWLAKQGIDDPSWQNSVTGALESKVYFVSDGRPTSSDTTSPFGGTGDGSNQVNDGEETIWQAALQAKGVQAIAVGVGADISGDSAALAQLGQVAYTPGGGADTPVITVTDENQLTAALGSTAPAPINGFLLGNDIVNPLDPLTSPKIFNLTLVDDADTDFVSQTFDANTWTIVTNNGTLVVDRTDGSYDYTPKAGSEGKSDSFVYTIKDTNGGDQDSATLTINIKAAPVITSDGGGATASINVVEGTKAVTDVNASDADTAQAGLSYSIVGGADAALFDIDSVTGVLSFKNAPDYENPADAGADNKYNVTVKVTDGGLSDTQAITVTVTDKNDVAPVLAIGGTSYTVRDNFDSVAFNGNNGTKNWLNNWTETNDDNAAATGDVRIESNSGSNALFLNDDDNDDSSIQRSVDLTGATQATLEFDYSFDTSSNDESVRVQISTDGTNWTDLLVLSGNVTQGTTHFTADISAYISANTRIRFLADSGLESSDSSWFDNVLITYGAPATNYATTFTEGAGAIAIASVVSSVTDTDSVNMQSATIVLTNAKANDVMAVGSLPAGITSNINTSVPGQITVTLTGPASKAAFEQAIEAVTFNNTSSTPDTTPRNITVTVNDGVANSNTATTTITVVDANSGPVIGNMGGALAYTENQSAQFIDTDVTVTDGDSANFNGGALTVSFAANGTTADQLSVVNQGNAAGQIGVSGATISYGGQVIGTLSGGDNGNPLVITFTTNNATPAAVDALIQRIAFANTSDAPSTSARTLNFVVTDGDGGTSNTGVATVNVTAVNDAPVLDSTKAPAFTAVNEDAAAPSGAVGTLVSVLTGFSNVSDADGAGALKGIAVTALNSTNGTWFYSTNNGSSWTAVSPVSGSSALLLRDTDRLYFQPNANFTGTVTDGITFRAWDQTTGTAGTKVNPGAGGGTTAYSTATDTASITVNAVNDNPVGVTERIIAADSTATVLSAWLTANDTDIDDPISNLFISGVTENDNEFGLDTGDLSADPISFDLTSLGAGEGGDITYVLKDGSGGTDNSTTVSVIGDNESDAYVGDDGADDGTRDIVIGTSGNEALSGRNGDDILVGNGGTDTFDGGSGTDTVVFRSNVTTIGTNFEDADLESIEIIDLGDGYDAVQFGASGSSGANRLNADDVLNITDNKDVALFIKGDNGDTVFIENTDGNKLTVSGTQDQAGYTHYTGTAGGNTVHLYVDSDVVVNSGTN